MHSDFFGHNCTYISSIQLGGIRALSLLGYMLNLGALGHFGLINRTKKLFKFIKILNCNKSSCIVFCVKMSYYSQYILITKGGEIFWSRDTSSIRDIRTFCIITNLYVPNCFKYTFWVVCPKKIRQEKNLNHVKMN